MGTSTDTENFETFSTRCEIFYPHADVVRMCVAYKLAKGSHAHQTRKDERNQDGTPVRYFEHLRRVGLIVLDEVGVIHRDLPVLGILHDAIEDTKLTAEEIAFVFGTDVSRRVLLMSKVPKAGFKNRLVQHGDWMVWMVKAADRLDNLRTMHNSSLAFRTKQVAETREMYYPLLDDLVEAIPEEWKLNARRLRSTLREECELVAKIP